MRKLNYHLINNTAEPKVEVSGCQCIPLLMTSWLSYSHHQGRLWEMRWDPRESRQCCEKETWALGPERILFKLLYLLLRSACLCPLKFIRWNLTLKVMMILRGGTFRRWLDHENRALMNEPSALIREASQRKLPCPFCLLRLQCKDSCLESGPLPDTASASSMVSDFPASRTGRNKRLLS